MPLLKETDQKQLVKEFKGLKTPVKMLMFTQDIECQFCKETRMIAEELAALSNDN